jgi:type I restriction enzyme S subunit
MSGWKTIKVCDIGKVITGNTPPRKKPELYGSHTIFIKPTDISEDSKYTLNPEECYSESGYKKFKKSLIPKGSTCVVTIGSIGKKITKAHCDCFINQAMNAVIPYSNYDEEFVYYLLKYNLVQLKTLDSGTASGRENVSKSSFSNIQVNVPINKSIQTKIGSILSAYDNLIENNLKRIKLLEEIAHRTYEEWFVKFLINSEQLPIDEQTGLPAGWERRKLKDLIKIVSGYPFKSTDYVDGGKYKIVTIKNVQDGYFVPFTTDSLLEIPPKVKNEQILHTGDIILSLTGNVGRVCLTYGYNYLLNQRVAKLVPSKNISSGFIYSIMRNEKMIYVLENISNGTAQQNLSPINMGNVEIVYPDENTVRNFNKLSDDSVKQICNLYIQNQYLKESRDILLPKLMNGTIKVSA